MKKLLLVFAFCCLPFVSYASDLFGEETPVVDNIQVKKSSDFFAEVFQKLSDVNFAGKDIRVAIESLETLSPNVKIALTDNRAIIVRDDDIIGNWPRPVDGDWQGFGEVTTALLLKIRESDEGLAKQPQGVIYSMAVAAITHGLDAGGRYAATFADNGKVLTSAGLDGKRDSQGNWRVTGVVKGSQADIAGINDSDLVVKINGADVNKLSDSQLAAAFAGFNSGTLKLKIATPTGTKNIVLRRASVVLTDADIVFRGKNEQNKDVIILEIIIYNISENSVAIVNQALAKYADANGIILDMRNARGGDERAAAKLAGLFLGEVPIMRIDDGSGEEVEVIPGGAAVTNAPVVVLVSNQTQGSAEAVALAFNENARGALVGMPTAGKARLTTKIDLISGGTIELGNRRIKSARGMEIDERGVFPLVCLSNIRNGVQQDAFLANVVNGDFKGKDFNSDPSVGADAIRRGCPSIKSGEDEDIVAAAISMKILTDNPIYRKLMENVSE